MEIQVGSHRPTLLKLSLDLSYKREAQKSQSKIRKSRISQKVIGILISSPELASLCYSITSLSKKRTKKRPLDRPYIELYLIFSPLLHLRLQNIETNVANSRFWRIRLINRAARTWLSSLKVRHSRRRIPHSFIRWIIDRSYQVSQAKSLKTSTRPLNIKQNSKTNNALRKHSSHLPVKSSS